jgi:hypothetical protein
VDEVFTMPRLDARQLQALGFLRPGAPEPEGLI